MAFLEVLNGPEVGHKSKIAQDTYFVGRESSNHLVLSDRTVSRKHAVINDVDGRFVISDLKSLKGILVNGEKAVESILEDGDEITMGAVRLRFVTDDHELSLPVSIIHRKKSAKKMAKGLAGVFIFLLIVFVTAKNPLSYFKKDSDISDIEKHYRQGIEAVNEDKNFAGAKEEFLQVLELDPQKKTIYARNASKLLRDFP